MSKHSSLSVDFSALEADLNDLRASLRAGASRADAQHLKRVALFGRLCTFLGWATAWVFPNPISMFALSLGIVGRWTTIAHHVTHRGYDRIEGLPARFHSKTFATGWWRRLVDWPDILEPSAWMHEHNTLHHYKLNEVLDPDQPEHNLGWLRELSIPRPLKYVVVFLSMLTWRWVYYPPNTMRELHDARRRRAGEPVEPGKYGWRCVMPWTPSGFDTWMRCFLPYFVLHFVLAPLPFLLLSPQAWAFALANRLGAELMANVHTFIVIVPSHAGADLLLFDEPISGRGEFYFRQMAGSANYRTGGFLNDYLHGYLNYQIEHHVFPDMSMLQVMKAQPQIKAIAQQHGIAYVQDSVWSRLATLVAVMVGTETMPHWVDHAKASAA